MSEKEYLALIQKNLTLSDNIENISRIKIELEQENSLLKEKIFDSTKKIDKINDKFKLVY